MAWADLGNSKVEQVCNAIELAGICLVLLMASALQYVLNELPCPLCLLQRVGFFCIAFGYLLNLRFGLRPSHYSIVILSAVFTSFVALRQIALHVVPGSGSYGAAFLGYHLYTWSFILCIAIIVVTTFLMGFDRQYYQPRSLNGQFKWLVQILFIGLVILLALNILNVFLECGFMECPDNPTRYLY